MLREMIGKISRFPIISIVTFGFCFIWSLVACGQLDPAPVVSHTPAPASPSNWKEFVSEKGRFSVSIPGTFRENTTQTKVGSGSTILIHSFYMAIQGNCFTFSVNYYDLPDVYTSISYDTVLDSASHDLEKTFQVIHPYINNVASLQILNNKNIFSEGNSGRALELENTNSLHGEARVFIQKNRIYQIITTTSYKDRDDPLKQSFAQKFLDSFRLG